MTSGGPYAFAPRVLRRWRDERLTLADTPDGEIEATFRFDGSTCGNVAFQLVYTARLAAAGEGYRILSLHCAPAPADQGHQQMCSYRENAERILSTLADEQPLLGQPLAAALAWSPAVSPAGCVCTAPARAHKWRAVLHTLHFALSEDAGVARGDGTAPTAERGGFAQGEGTPRTPHLFPT